MIASLIGFSMDFPQKVRELLTKLCMYKAQLRVYVKNMKFYNNVEQKFDQF